MHIVGNEIHKT